MYIFTYVYNLLRDLLHAIEETSIPIYSETEAGVKRVRGEQIAMCVINEMCVAKRVSLIGNTHP